MSENVLTEIYSNWQSEVGDAYQKAENILDRKLTGKLVQLIFPKVDGEKYREESVTGVVSHVSVGPLLEENIQFAVWVELKGGRRYVDPEAIKICETNAPNREWKSVDSQLPPKRFETSDLSKKVEVYLSNGERKLDRYNFHKSRWEVEGEGKTVQHWKPLEPDPDIQ